MARTRRFGTALHLALGLGVLGAAGYAFVAVVGHVFERPDEAGALSALISLYLVVNIIGPGVFAALEQETSRAVSSAVARGEPTRPVARRAAVLAARSLAVLVLAVLVAWPLFLGRVLDGRVGLLVALLVAIGGSAAVYWTRGVLGGQQRFDAYARTLYVEGAVRLLPGLLLVAVAVASPAAYGVAFALGSALAALSVAATMRLPRPGTSGATGVAPAGMGRSLSYLMVAVSLSQLVANLAPVVVTYRSPGDLVAAGVFASTFVLARIPLFLFAPVQAVLLPKLTRAAVLGHRAELGRLLWQVVGIVLVVGAAGVVGSVLVGPWAAEVLFNTAVRPSVTVLGLLAAATMLMLVALVVQPTLIALGRQNVVTIGWISGAVVFLGLLVAPVAPITAALSAQLAGPAVVVAVLAVGVVRALRAAHPGAAAHAPQVGWRPHTGRSWT